MINIKSGIQFACGAIIGSCGLAIAVGVLTGMLEGIHELLVEEAKKELGESEK